MRILGIDPGLTRLGHGCIEINEDEMKLIAYGLISHPRDPLVTYNAHLNSGIKQIAQDLPRLIDMTRPDLICSELVPPGRLGQNTELVVAAISTCKIIAFQFGIEWMDIAANSVKKIVTGEGTASKAKIKNTVFQTFPTVKERHKQLQKEQKESGEKATGLPPDVMDAIAISMAGLEIYANNTEAKKQEEPLC